MANHCHLSSKRVAREACGCASSVERPVPRAVDLSYLSIPGPQCRGTHLPDFIHRERRDTDFECALMLYVL